MYSSIWCDGFDWTCIILSYSGFIDVEDLAEENDLAIFDDIMSTAEISRLERQLELFRKKNLRNLIGQTITTKK